MDIENTDIFMQNYRDSLKRARDTQVAQLDQQRRNDQARLMSQANKAGMLYSNLPQRAKVQYDTESYYPNLTKIQTNYQTGLDSLRSQGVNLANQIKYYQDAMADIDYYSSLLS